MRPDAFDPANDDAGPMTGIVLRHLSPQGVTEGEALMRRILAESRRFEGYLGSDIYPPVPGVQEGYVIIYRYASRDALQKWLDAPIRHEMVRRLETLESQPKIEFHFASRRRDANTVSTVLAYRVRPDQRAAFSRWRARIYEACRHQPGYLGTESFPSVENGQEHIIVVLRFDSREHLDAWMASDERATYMDEVCQYVERVEVRRVGTGFEGWFEFGPLAQAPPARWRQWFMILGALFPVIMVLKTLLGFVFTLLPFPVAFLILLMVDVAVLTYFIMPLFSRVMEFWLRPKPGATWRTEAAGLAILLGIIAATLVVFLCVVPGNAA